MSSPKNEIAKKKTVKMPHVLLIIAIVIVLACILSYIVPTGQFDKDEAGNVIPGTYHPVDRAPVNPWDAILLVKGGIEGGASVISLLLISNVIDNEDRRQLQELKKRKRKHGARH